MPTYTVHAPPAGNESADPQRFLFVRDGFFFWAFVLAPLWLLMYRLWLALAGYLALSFIIGVSMRLLGLADVAQFAISLLIGLLVGFEASTLQRWTLARRGWRTLGFAVGDDLETAEQHFFAAWSRRVPDSGTPSASPAETFAAPLWRGAPAPSDVIGLFPEPGGTR